MRSGLVSRRIRAATAIVASMLMVVIGGLLWSNYDAQMDLRRSARARFHADGERLAGTVGYFFSERRDDLQTLSESRELAAFFENRALGMSMAYGLRTSQKAVVNRFQRMLARKRFHGGPIYTRVVFIDMDADVLVDIGPGSPGAPHSEDLKRHLPPIWRKPALVHDDTNEAFTVMVCVSYFFKDAHAGQLLAWLSPQPIFDHLLKPETPSAERIYGLVCDGDTFHTGPGVAVPFAGRVSGGGERPAGGFPAVPQAGRPVASGGGVITVHLPIEGTPFGVAMVAPPSDVFGDTAPWVLPVAMGIISPLIVAGSIGLWHSGTRNTLLRVRLEETAKRERVTREKSAQLEREITRRRRSESALKESERKYRSIFESFQDIYFRADAKTRIVVVSPSVAVECGYAPGELIGRPAGGMLADGGERRRLMRTLLTAGVVKDYETRLLKKDGAAVDVSLNAKLLRDSGGRLLGMEGVLRNISRRKRDRAALEEKQQRLNLVLEAGHLGVWDWHVPSGELTFNAQWANMLGYAPDELEPRVDTWEGLLHPQDRKWTLHVLREHLEDRIPYYETEHRLRSKSGEWKWILDRGQVVKRDAAGNALRMAGTHMDITFRKTAEIEINRYQENLEQLVAERTQELKQAQQKLVGRAMEAGRAQLAAMVLHNIGNAVTPIRVQLDRVKSSHASQAVNYLECCLADLNAHKGEIQRYIEQDPRGGQVFDYMATLVSALKKAERREREILERLDDGVTYISEVLTLQQAYAVDRRENRECTGINGLLTDAVRMQTGALEKRGVRVVLETDPDDPQLIIDKNRLMQVIVNIIKNGYEAIDAADGPEADKRLTFRTFSENGKTGFSVGDTGVGLAPERSEKIFEYGQSSKGSSGFGLYYCRMFVEANGGAMHLESPGQGRGATVTVWLPEGRPGVRTEVSAA